MKTPIAAFASAALASLVGIASPAHATTYPLTVTDLAGRTVTIEKEPQRVVVQDGRDLLTLALLDRKDPFARVVTWNNLLKRADPGLWSIMLKKWPAAGKIPNMNFSDNGSVNPETIIAQQPQLIIAQLRAKPVFEQTHILQRMAEVHVPVVFIDTEQNPIPDTTKTVELLGKVLNREKEANQYVSFYQTHLKNLQDTIAKIAQPHPSVFVEAKAGFSNGQDCCFTHNTVGWGQLLKAVDAPNVGAQLLHTPSGSVTMENVIGAKPDVYIMTGLNLKAPGNIAVPLGYDTSRTAIDANFAKLAARPGFMQTKAAQDGQVYGIYHLFYNHPYNIVGMEYLAKIVYPKAFAKLDPTADWNDILRRYTDLPVEPVTLEAKMPAQH